MSPYSHPDDSSLAEVSTLPRGQVDYLSHEWIEEEDVWRSWRNMTKQKKEIANGIRLENASWRTWWKQRNKLKTVTPETLNWLKDSDVTWLYGPLHTAVVWSPPPVPTPGPTSVEKAKSAHDRLDLSELSAKYYKPILKHRSITDMLTSELLPNSPLFHCAPSQQNLSPHQHHHTAPSSRTHSPVSEELGVIVEEDDLLPNRPGLYRAQSEIHVPPARLYSATNLNGYFSAHMQGSTSRRGGSPNIDGLGATVTAPPVIASGPSTPGTNTPATGSKKKHISFNTFVEQCIAIDKSETAASSTSGSSSSLYDYWTPGDINDRGVMGGHGAKTSAKGVKWGYGTQFDEDSSSDGCDSDVPTPELKADPQLRPSPVWNGIENAIESDSDDETTLQIQTKRNASSSSVNSATMKRQKRSASKSSSASTSSSSSGSSAPPPRKRRNSSHQLVVEHGLLQHGPAENKRTHRKRQGSLPVQTGHVTIQPIAPTMLKTTGVGNGWTGDNYMYSAYGGYSTRGYGAVFSDDDDDDTGVVIGRVVQPQATRAIPHEGTPVELVYLPTVAGQYSRNPAEDSDDDVEDPDTVYHYYGPRGSSGDVASETIPVAVARTPPVVSNLGTNPTAPIGILAAEAESSAYDYFEGPDLGSGVDFARRMRTHSKREEFSPQSVPDNDGGLRLGLGPALVRYSQGGPSSPSNRTLSPDSILPKSSPTVSGLLSAPARGRGSSATDSSSSSSQSRGRSSTRTSSTSNSLSRERSSHSSSLGSLSPDGGPTYGVYGASTGRIVRDKESREDRKERKLRQRQNSSSPESEGGKASNSSNSSSTTITIVAQAPIPMTLPGANNDKTPTEASLSAYFREEDSQRSLHPTPSNSPINGISTIKKPPPQSKIKATDPPVVNGHPPPVATTSVSIPIPKQGAEVALGKTTASRRQRRHETSPDPDQQQAEGGTISRAVGMASAILNLWSGAPANTATTSTPS